MMSWKLESLSQSTKSDIGGCFSGIVVHSTYNELVKHFGKPFHMGSGDGKTNAEWMLEIKPSNDMPFVNTPMRFSLYNYKDDTNPVDNPDSLYCWNIGYIGLRAKDIKHATEYYTYIQGIVPTYLSELGFWVSFSR